MNCGISCLKKYFEIIGYDGKDILTELESCLCDEGLSIHDIVSTLNRNGFECTAWYDRKVSFDFPYLMYDKRKKHYTLVAGYDGVFFYVYDDKLGEIRLFHWLFRLFWQKYYVCVKNSVI